MSQRTRVELVSQIVTDLPDNVEGLISPEDVRNVLVNMLDSTYMPEDSGSMSVKNSITSSLAFTASYVPASGVVGLNLAAISTGSITASVAPTGTIFALKSGSSSILSVSDSNIITGTSYPKYRLDISGSVNTGKYSSYGSTYMNIVSGSNIVLEIPIYDYTNPLTYNSCFINYSITDGTNSRAGNIASVWNTTYYLINNTETTTADLGYTGNVNVNISLYEDVSYMLFRVTVVSLGSWLFKMSYNFL